MKKILVTGGTGFIGSNIVKRLVKEKYNVTVLDNNSRGNIGRLSSIIDKINYIEGDIRNRDLVIDSSKGSDTIIHLAYINGTKFFYEKPYEVLDVATKGMNNILDSMDANLIDNLILASSSEVYNEPKKIPTDENIEIYIPDILNPRFSYGGGKIISELLSINYGRKKDKNVIIFRPHNVYGPDMGKEHFIPEIVKKIKNELDKEKIEIKIQGSGNETRAFIFIEDFVDGIMLIMQKGKSGNIYNIGTDKEVTINDIINIISSSIQKKIKIIKTELKDGSTRRRCPNIKKISDLGFKSSVSLEDGIKKTVSWYLQN